MKAKAVNKTLGDVEAEKLVDRLANALLDVVAKKNDTLTIVEAEAPVKKEGDTFAGQED